MGDFSASDQRFMALALTHAATAASLGEVPVGAVVVLDNDVIAEACNQQITLNDPSAHAEMLAIRAAASLVGNYRLPGCELFVTLEPCTMCCGVMVHARVSRLVFGAREPKAGAVVSAASALDNASLNHRIAWSEGLGASESADLLRSFFKERRASKAQRRPLK